MTAGIYGRLARAMFILNQIRNHKLKSATPPAHLQQATHQPQIASKPLPLLIKPGLPSQTCLADKTYEQTTQRDINWRKFDNGADVVVAISASSIDIGNMAQVHWQPVATKGVPLEVFGDQ